MATNDKQRLTSFINPSITKHTKAQAVVDELSLTNLVENALINYLQRNSN